MTVTTTSVIKFVKEGKDGFTVRFRTFESFFAFRRDLASKEITKATQENSNLQKSINNLNYYLSKSAEELVIASLSPATIRKISEISGRGLQADLVEIGESGEETFSEVKNIAVNISDDKLTANKGITLGSIALKNITNIAARGIVDDSNRVIQRTERFALADNQSLQTRFFNNLLSSKNKFKWLDDQSKNNTPFGKAAQQIITNIELKSSKVYITTPKKAGGVEVTQIGWKWNQLLNAKGASIVRKGTDSIEVVFSEALVTNALRNAERKFQFNNITQQVIDSIQDILANSAFDGKAFLALEKILGQQKFEQYFEYIKGSVKVYEAKITEKKKSRRKTASDKVFTLSDLELSVLVQKATEARMPRGPLRGPPLSETVLTYRTGQFVESIRVTQNFRQRLIRYYYSPNYKIHERRGGRPPRYLLQASIRDTVKQVYGAKFRIIRGF